MDAQALLKERKELFDNVYQFKHNSRVPYATNNSYWSTFDAGYSADAWYDYDKMDKIADIFFERYDFDAYMSTKMGWPILNINKDFGPQNLRIIGEAAVLTDFCCMEREEYGEWAEDLNTFLWTKFTPRNMPGDYKVWQLQHMVKELGRVGAYSAKNAQKVREYGRLQQWMVAGTIIPIEDSMGTLRGIKNTSLDLRKCKGQMKEAMDIFFENVSLPTFKSALNRDSSDYVAEVQIAMMAHSILNRKQFEELYWPYVMKVVNFCQENNLKMWFYCEAEILRFADFFQEIPKGLAIVQVEQDDIFEVRKQIPNVALAGGMPLDLLGNATAQECIEHAKKLINEMGDGFVMTEDKMACTRNDIKRDNLLAVLDFVKGGQY